MNNSRLRELLQEIVRVCHIPTDIEGVRRKLNYEHVAATAATLATQALALLPAEDQHTMFVFRRLPHSFTLWDHETGNACGEATDQEDGLEALREINDPTVALWEHNGGGYPVKSWVLDEDESEPRTVHTTVYDTPALGEYNAEPICAQCGKTMEELGIDPMGG